MSKFNVSDVVVGNDPKDQAQYQVLASCFDPVSIVVEKPGSFKVGDVVVGNAGANRYGKTVEGWYGIVTKIGYSSEGREYITVKPAVCNSAGEWILDPTEGVEYPVLSSCTWSLLQISLRVVRSWLTKLTMMDS